MHPPPGSLSLLFAAGPASSRKRTHSMSTETDASMPSTPAPAAGGSSSSGGPAGIDDDAARERVKKWRAAAKHVLTDITSKRYANKFSAPVSDKEAPNYRDVVRRPMDLGTVKARLADGVRRRRGLGRGLGRGGA